ncbi:hypothetical protein HZA38_01310 [Candidatus Peregrinibacteria bacterium]|nr:hypothetical protein [Candidatus Peregrinibacteria bacterium]
MTFDITEKGELLVFIGINDVLKTAKIYQLQGKKITLEEVAKKISQQFGGAEVVVMGRAVQKENFHGDQSYIVLEGKQVPMNQYKGFRSELLRKWYEDQHKDYKEQFQTLGYKVISHSAAQRSILDHASSLNAIPYIDKLTGGKKILFPVFYGQYKGEIDEKEKLSKDDLNGDALAAYEMFAKSGYTPIPIRDNAHLREGNTHCISNVIAKIPSEMRLSPLAA